MLGGSRALYWTGNCQRINSILMLKLAIERENIGVLEQLLSKGLSGDAILDGSGTTALIAAVRSGNLEVVRMVLRTCTSVNAQTYQGWAALHEASHRGLLTVAEMLVAAGSDVQLVDVDQLTALHLSVEHPAVLAFLLKTRSCNIDRPDKELDTALHLACAHGLTSSVELLIRAGANLNLANFLGQTPLHIAILNDHVDVVKLLIQNNCSLDAEAQRSFNSADPPATGFELACQTPSSASQQLLIRLLARAGGRTRAANRERCAAACPEPVRFWLLQPRPLRHLVRAEVRRLLPSGAGFARSVHSLPLPRRLIEFLMLI